MENNVSLVIEYKHTSYGNISYRCESSSNTGSSLNNHKYKHDNAKKRECSRHGDYGKNRERFRYPVRGQQQSIQQQSPSSPLYGCISTDSSYVETTELKLPVVNCNFGGFSDPVKDMSMTRKDEWSYTGQHYDHYALRRCDYEGEQQALAGVAQKDEFSYTVQNGVHYVASKCDKSDYSGHQQALVSVVEKDEYGYSGQNCVHYVPSKCDKYNYKGRQQALTGVALKDEGGYTGQNYDNYSVSKCDKYDYKGLQQALVGVAQKDECGYTGQNGIHYAPSKCDKYDYESQQQALVGVAQKDECRKSTAQNGVHYVPSKCDKYGYEGQRQALTGVAQKEEYSYTGQNSIHYAPSKCDKYNYESQQQALVGVVRSEQRSESHCYRQSTSHSTVHSANYQAAALAEKFHAFRNECLDLVELLKRGACNKKNAATFYSQIQSIYSHAKHLITNEKSKCDSEKKSAKQVLQKQEDNILLLLNDVNKVFDIACIQKVWDHFTKSQRKHIDFWKKQVKDIKTDLLEEVLKNRVEDEMEISDDDGENSGNLAKKSENLDKVKAEEYKGEEAVVEMKDSKKEILVFHGDNSQRDSQINEETGQLDVRFSFKRSGNDEDMNEYCSFKYRKCENKQDKNTQTCFEMPVNCSLDEKKKLTEREVRIICLVSMYLQIYSSGASLDSICSYLNMNDSAIASDELINLLKQYPTLFKEDSDGIKSSLGKVKRLLDNNKNKSFLSSSGHHRQHCASFSQD